MKECKQVFSYLIFGALTTLVNVAVYYLCYNVANVPNILSVIIAWILSVAFAYITNKFFVFESRSFERGTLIHEGLSFVGCRVLTGVIDVVIMYVAVDMLSGNSLFWKLISNIIVILLNFIVSKILIFKNR